MHKLEIKEWQLIVLLGLAIAGILGTCLSIHILESVRNITTSSEPITPEIKLIITDNKVDTLYVYKLKD